MVVHAPFHPDTALPKRSEPNPHEFLEEVTQDDGTSSHQRRIAWLCAFLVAAAGAAIWYLL